jgi:hypothetical protein
LPNDVASLQASPNPFTDKLNIEFSLASASRVRVEIFNVSGQRITTLFDGDVKADELKKIEYSPATNCDCMVIYRLQTEQGTYFGRAVMVK